NSCVAPVAPPPREVVARRVDLGDIGLAPAQGPAIPRGRIGRNALFDRVSRGRGRFIAGEQGGRDQGNTLQEGATAVARGRGRVPIVVHGALNGPGARRYRVSPPRNRGRACRCRIGPSPRTST